METETAVIEIVEYSIEKKLEYSDRWETCFVVPVQTGDGNVHDVWIYCGVPAYQRGTATAAGGDQGHTLSNYWSCWVDGDCGIDAWCPESLQPAIEADPDLLPAILAAAEPVLTALHFANQNQEVAQ